MTRVLLEQTWNGSAWVNYGVMRQTYDANGYKTIALEQIWSVSTWVNFSLDSYTWNANGHESVIVDQTWKNNAWVNGTQENFSYDANGNNTSILQKAWENNSSNNSSIFQYTWQPVNGMKVIAPVQGETVLAGSPYDILWQAVDIPIEHQTLSAVEHFKQLLIR